MGATDSKPRTDLWEVLTGVSTTGFLASGSGSDGLNGTLEKVAELKSLHEVTICALAPHCSSRYTSNIRVPDHAPILDTDILEGIVNVTQFLNALVQTLLGAVMRMYVRLVSHSKVVGGSLTGRRQHQIA